MESGLTPNFTDKTILYLLNELNWIDLPNGLGYREIKLGNSAILADLNLRAKADWERPFAITFATEESVIGTFGYDIQRSPFSFDICLSRRNILFQKTVDRKNYPLSRSEAIERLMDYPDFKEWLIWNQP